VDGNCCPAQTQSVCRLMQGDRIHTTDAHDLSGPT